MTTAGEPQARRCSRAQAAWSAGQPDRARALLDQAGRHPADAHLRGKMEYLRGSIELACGVPLAAHASLLAGADLVADLDPPLAAKFSPRSAGSRG